MLKRDAVAKVVLNNLYKHTQLQDTFGANMLALVDDVPRTLSIDAFVRHWVTHQLDVIVRRTTLPAAPGRGAGAHPARLPQGARRARRGHRPDPRARATVEEAREGLMALLEVDEIQARAILNLQLRQLAALERQKIIDEYDGLMVKIADYAGDPRQARSGSARSSATELDEIVAKYGDERRTQILPYDGEVSMEDLIAEEEVVVTITRGGYAKRTRSDAYRVQKRGGKGVRGAQLRADDVVEHFGVTTTHHWLLFFTNLGRVYRAKAYELPEGGRDSKGQHVANLLAFQPGEQIAKVIDLRDYDAGRVPGARHPPRPGEEDPPRGVRLQPLRRPHRDQPARGRGRPPGRAGLGGRWSTRTPSCCSSRARARPCASRATADQLRPMGRATSGVTGHAVPRRRRAARDGRHQPRAPTSSR